VDDATEPRDHTYASRPRATDENRQDQQAARDRPRRRRRQVKVLYIEGLPAIRVSFVKKCARARGRADQVRGKKETSPLNVYSASRPDFAGRTGALSRASWSDLNSIPTTRSSGPNVAHGTEAGREESGLLRDLAREGMGGCVFIAGEQHMPQSYIADTRLRDVCTLIPSGPAKPRPVRKSR